MFAKFALPLFGLLACGSAAPSMKPLSDNDVLVLQLAHYLENLEFSLYSGGCKKFSDADYKSAGLDATKAGICLIAQHEKTHAKTLASVLKAGGQKPLPACEYKFPYKDAKSFLDVANMVTSVGIGAYLGGAELIMDNDKLLTEATSILTVEARHDAYLRAGVSNVKGAPFPTPFDTSLTGVYAYTLAQPFVKHCPKKLPIKALPSLKLVSPKPSPNLHPIKAGTKLTFTWDPSEIAKYGDHLKPLYIALINQDTSPRYLKVHRMAKGKGSVELPKGVKGAAFAVLTGTKGGLNEDMLSAQASLAGPAEIIVS